MGLNGKAHTKEKQTNIKRDTLMNVVQKGEIEVQEEAEIQQQLSGDLGALMTAHEQEMEEKKSVAETQKDEIFESVQDASEGSKPKRVQKKKTPRFYRGSVSTDQFSHLLM